MDPRTNGTSMLFAYLCDVGLRGDSSLDSSIIDLCFFSPLFGVGWKRLEFAEIELGTTFSFHYCDILFNYWS